MSAHFREVERTLELARGFVLVPVECGPDVARALTDWLGESGWPTAVIEPVDDAGWRELVARLMDAAASDARVVVVIGSRESAPGASAALRLVNQRRDALASALGRPLLWCGPPEFLKIAWERAPDFWSIRAMTRKVSTPSGAWTEAPLWPGTWVTDPPERLREMVATAREQGNAPIASSAATLLAEALVARGELEEAAEVVADAGGGRALRVVEAVLAAARGDRTGRRSWSRPATGPRATRGSRAGGSSRSATCRSTATWRPPRPRTCRPRGCSEERATPRTSPWRSRTWACSRWPQAASTRPRSGCSRPPAWRAGAATPASRRACCPSSGGCTCCAATRGAHAPPRGGARPGVGRLRPPRPGRGAAAPGPPYLELGDPEKAEQDARRAAAIDREMGDEWGPSRGRRDRPRGARGHARGVGDRERGKEWARDTRSRRSWCGSGRGTGSTSRRR